eukprot:1858973-Rhodomonas_salina.1
MPTASERLGICTTAIKKLCRKFGIKKWPYRTLMSTSRRSRTSNFEELMVAIEQCEAGSEKLDSKAVEEA